MCVSTLQKDLPSIDRTRVKKILVGCHHGIGDVVMILPVLERLHHSFINAQIDVFIGNQAEKELFRLLGYGCRCYSFNVKEESGFALLSLIKKMRRERYDLAIDLGWSPRRYDVWLFHLAGCKKIISGGNTGRFGKRYIGFEDKRNEHRVVRNMQCLTALGIPAQPIRFPVLNIPEQVSACMKRKFLSSCEGKQMVGICVGTGDFFYRKGLKKHRYDAKQWGYEKFCGLAGELARSGTQIILFGGEKEKRELAGRSITFAADAINTIGTTSMTETMALLNACDLVIGGDTGLLHCAAALNKKILAVFGPTDPNIIGPVTPLCRVIQKQQDCIPCYRLSATRETIECRRRLCLEEISVREVAEEAKRMLE